MKINKIIIFIFSFFLFGVYSINAYQDINPASFTYNGNTYYFYTINGTRQYGTASDASSICRYLTNDGETFLDQNTSHSGPPGYYYQNWSAWIWQRVNGTCTLIKSFENYASVTGDSQNGNFDHNSATNSYVNGILSSGYNNNNLTISLSDLSSVVVNGIGPPPSCTDGIKNQDETGVDYGGVCGIPVKNQVAPDDYFDIIDSNGDSVDNTRNCLYTNPYNTAYDKPLKMCRTDVIQGVGTSLDTLCESGKAYVNYIMNSSSAIYIRAMVCATANNENTITDVKLNDYQVEPFHTFESIIPYQQSFQSGSTLVYLKGILQTYNPLYPTSAYLVPNDVLIKAYKNINANQVPIRGAITDPAKTSNGKTYQFYFDENYLQCVHDSPLTCELDYHGYFNVFASYSFYPGQYSNVQLYASRIYNTGSVSLSGIINGDNPLGDVEYNPPPFDSSTQPDNSELFDCTFDGAEWWEYVTIPFKCAFASGKKAYAQGVVYMTNTAEIIKVFMKIGSDKSATKRINFEFELNPFKIENANATSSGFAMDFGNKFVGITNGGGLFGKYYQYLYYAIFSMIVIVIFALFLTHKK